MLEVLVRSTNSLRQAALFLVDSGADRTVFSADLLSILSLATELPVGVKYQGIGGEIPIVLLTAVLELIRTDGGIATIRGQFAGFTDPRASDVSILGRDVLDHFDVVQSRRRNEILLLAPPHQYQIIP